MGTHPFAATLTALCFLWVCAIFTFVTPQHVMAEKLVFASSQLTLVDEADKMRRVVLKNYPEDVEFLPVDDKIIFARLMNQSDGVPDIVGGVHGDLSKFMSSDTFAHLEELAPEFSASPLAYSEFGAKNGHQFYIPWMQGAYAMVAHRTTLQDLPAGAELESLTYEQFLQWVGNVEKRAGRKILGLPAGRHGLMHRFLQGFLYPSFTGGMISGFSSPEAHGMWSYLRNLWKHATQRSLSYSRMDTPMLQGEVLIAWDHVARLMNLFRSAAEDYIVFPAPSGPKGRGFFVVLAGLAIPTGSQNKVKALGLIRYLTRPETQITLLENVGFFPVAPLDGYADTIPSHLRQLNAMVQAQHAAPNGVPALLPVGLGKKNAEFNTIFMTAFSRIVLRSKDIGSTLNMQNKQMERIFQEVNVPCWAPDPPTPYPCQGDGA